MNKKEYLENDYELLYLIRNHNEEALEIMFKKYENLIYSKILKYHFPINAIDDYLQEGRMTLLKAIETYNEEYEKTFTRYFELLLQNRFNTLYKENKKYRSAVIFVEDERLDVNTKYNKQEIKDINFDIDNLSKFEKIIYKYYFENSFTISDIAEKMEVTHKQVYNSIQRIKKKLQKELIKK